MKALLKILYFFLLLIILFLLVGIFLPKGIKLSANISINAAPEIVFDQVNNLRNWDNWVPWHLNDTTIIIAFSDLSKGKGASYSWKGQNSGAGKVTIAESDPSVKILAEMDFGKQGIAISGWQFKEDSGETYVKWDFENNNLKYFERYFMFFFKNNMLKTFNLGLTKLKETSEELKYDRISDVQEVKVSQIKALAITDSSSVADIGENKSLVFHKLKSYLDRRKIVPIAKPFIIYGNWNAEEVKTFTCAYPVAEKTWSWNEFKYIEIDSCEALKITHWGRYGSNKPYKALTQYINDNNLTIAGSPWEVYENDSISEADTSKWQTDIFFPVKKE